MSEAVRDVLVTAKRILLERGWCQDVAEDDTGRCCLLGALSKAHVDEDQAPWRDAVAALSRDLPRLGHHCANLVVWNDAPRRTLEDVLDLLDRTIEGVKQ